MATALKKSKLSKGSLPTASGTKASMKKSQLSDEMIVDSDEDNAVEDRSSKTTSTPIVAKAKPKKSDATPATTNGTKRKSKSLSSSSESEDESESSESDSEEDDGGRPAKKAKVVPEQRRSKEASSNDEEETSEDEDEDEDEDMPDVDIPSNGNQVIEKATLVDPSTFASIPAQPFRPPAGYTALDSQALASSLLTDKDFQGKQLWHICVPARIPLDSIKEIALDAIATNTTAITHKDMEYAWKENSEGDMFTIMLASRDGYTSTSQRIVKKLSLQQKIDLPHLSTKQASQVTGSSAAADIAQASVTSIRPQPKGLKMRYKPPGFGSGEPGVVGFDSESENEDNGKSALQFPVTLGGASEEQTALEGSKKKAHRKKKGSDMENGAKDHHNAGLRHEEGSSASVAKTPVMKVVAPEAEDTSMIDAAKRKEAKRLRKEAKKAKRAPS